MGVSEQRIWPSVPAFRQFVWTFLVGMVLTVPGILIVFCLILIGPRLKSEFTLFTVILFCLFALLFLYIGIRSIVYSARGIKRVQLWETEGQITNGEIDEVWAEAHYSRYEHYTLYLIRYSFRVMENAYIMQQAVSKKEYDALKSNPFYKGKIVSIKFLPDKPFIARIVKLRE